MSKFSGKFRNYDDDEKDILDFDVPADVATFFQLSDKVDNRISLFALLNRCPSVNSKSGRNQLYNKVNK